MYQELYDIEERGKFLSVGEHEELRSSEARPVWQRMRELLDSKVAGEVLPKAKSAEVLRYGIHGVSGTRSRSTWATAGGRLTTTRRSS